MESLRGVIGGTGQNVVSRYQTLNSIGLSFGPIGSAPGTANTLQLNSATFQAALQADPLSVQNALSTLTLSASIAGGSTGSITGMTGSYKGTKTGKFVITDDGAGHLTSTFTPGDGSAAVTQSVTVGANSTESTLVLGMTLNIGALQPGTTTINVTQTSASVMQQLQQFLNGQVGAHGTLQSRSDEFTAVSKDIDAQKARIQANIDSEVARLQAGFTAMEQAQAQSSSILNTLTQTQNAWAAQANSSKSGG
jgi:flagellar capping protein FliD